MKSKFNMLSPVIAMLCISVILENAVAATYNSNSGEHTWSNNSSWSNGTAPTTANNVNNDMINIGSTTVQSKVILNTSYVPDKTTSIRVFSQCTLVVAYAELNLNNNSNSNTDLQIDAGGVLIVLGDLESLKNLAVTTGGKVIVLGNVSTGNTVNDVINNTGNFYVVGDFIDNGSVVPPTNVLNTTGSGTAGGLTELLANEPEIISEVLTLYPNFATGLSDNIVYAKANGNWSTMTWDRIGTTTETPPTATDMVVINGYSVTLDQSVAVNSLVMNNSTSSSQLTLTGSNIFTATDIMLNNSNTSANVSVIATNTSHVNVNKMAFNGVAASNTAIYLNDNSSLSVTGRIESKTYGQVVVRDDATYSVAGYNAKTFYAKIGTVDVSYENININAGGTYEINGTISVSGMLNLTNGILNTAGGVLSLASGATASAGSNTSYVNGAMTRTGTGTFTFPVGAGGFYAPISINPASSSTYTAQYFASAPANRTALATDMAIVSPVEYWDIHKVAGAGTQVTLHFPDATRSKILIPSKLLLAHWNGTVWENMGRTASTANSVTSEFMTSFSPVTSGGETSSTLPVELIDFTMRFENNKTVLNWKTASETNSDYFLVEKSTDGIHFTSLDKVTAAGNSSSMRSYMSIDEETSFGTIYYRIKQYDFDGTEHAVRTISAVQPSRENAVSMKIQNNLISNSDDLMINFSSQYFVEISIQVYNSNGNTIHRKTLNMGTSQIVGFQLELNTSLPKGMYYIQCSMNDAVFIETFIIE